MTLTLVPHPDRVSTYCYAVTHREDLRRLRQDKAANLKAFLEYIFGEGTVRLAHDLDSHIASITVETYRKTSEACIPIAIREITGITSVQKYGIPA